MPAPREKPSSDQPIVFVVDDDRALCQAIDSLLRSIGLKVVTFGAADEFLAMKSPDCPCCLVLDIRLPGIGGLDFQRELGEIGIDIPIVFMTGHGDIPMTVRAMKAGAVEFLTKPFRDQDLLDAIQTAIGRSQTQREQNKSLVKLRASFHSLTPREQEIITLVTTGLMNKQVAAQLGLSEITVKVHRGNVMRKMGAGSFAELIRMADALGLRRSGPH